MQLTIERLLVGNFNMTKDEVVVATHDAQLPERCAFSSGFMAEPVATSRDRERPKRRSVRRDGMQYRDHVSPHRYVFRKASHS